MAEASRAAGARRTVKGWLAWTAAASLAVALLAPLGCSEGAGGAAGEGVAAARGGDADEPDGPLTVFVGRPEALMGPLLDDFGDAEDADLEVRYGTAKELLDAALAQVTTHPVDVFIAPDAVTLGALSRRGLLRELPMDLVALVPARFAAVEQRRDWVGLTARPRGIVYDRTKERPEALPHSLEELKDRRFRARFGVAPGSPSFQAHMAVYRVLKGEEALDSLLAGIRDNLPRTYGDDSGVVQAILRGEVGWGLVDLTATGGDLQSAPPGRLAVAFLDQGDAGGFVDAAAAGVLTDDPRGVALLRFLLAAEAQERLADTTGEYPLAAAGNPPAGLPKLATLRTAPVDFADVAAVYESTGKALRRLGLWHGAQPAETPEPRNVLGAEGEGSR